MVLFKTELLFTFLSHPGQYEYRIFHRWVSLMTCFGYRELWILSGLVWFIYNSFSHPRSIEKKIALHCLLTDQ